MNIEEKFHWKEYLCTAMTLAVGAGFIVSGVQESYPSEMATYLLMGFALVIVSIAAFSFTGGWKHANDLPMGKKIVAYLPVLAMGLFFIALFILIEIAKSAFKK